MHRFAEGHNCDNLKNTALAYVHRHFPQVCESEEFLDTPREIVIQFLESEHVKVDSEYQVSDGEAHYKGMDVMKFSLSKKYFRCLGTMRSYTVALS